MKNESSDIVNDLRARDSAGDLKSQRR